MSGIDFKSRIVGHGEEAPDQLLANPANWRIHPRAQQDAMKGVLDQVGWVQSVIVNRVTGHLIDGHMRVSLALREDAKTIPVAYVELTPEEESLVLATLDPLSALAGTDKEKLAELLAEVSTDSAELANVLNNLGNDGSGMSATDRLAEWAGMPEFSQDDQTSWKQVIVHFNTPEDLEAFSKLLGQTLTPKTRSIWYPEAEIGRLVTKRYVNEQS